MCFFSLLNKMFSGVNPSKKYNVMWMYPKNKSGISGLALIFLEIIFILPKIIYENVIESV